jgi:hypothetical protein
MPEPKAIHPFPGMGADSRLFHKLHTTSRIVPLDWIRHEPHWRISDYARRWCRGSLMIWARNNKADIPIG